MSYDPTLSLTTASFEIMAAIWALRGPGRREIVKPAGAILLLLAGYQILEVLICSSSTASWYLPQLAFINVTWLPPTGILLAHRLRSLVPPSGRYFARGMFALAFGFSGWIAAHPGFASEPVCQVVFARYAHTPAPYLAYAAFYWVGLLGMVLIAGHGATYSADPHGRRLSTQLLIGSLAFILPSLLTSWVFRIPEGAFASIMCHYALFLAVFLARILYLERRSSTAEERVPVEE